MITATNLHGSTVGSPFVTCKDSHLAANLGNTTNGVLDGVVGITVRNRQSGPGVVICGLRQGSLCVESGIHVGDVVFAVNGVAVSSHEEAIREVDAAALNELSGDGIIEFSELSAMLRKTIEAPVEVVRPSLARPTSK